MKTSLEALPETKRRELARVVEILFSEFEDAIALATMSHKRQGRILKVILYGSYARGDWVDDAASGYVSDYDLLVVVNHEKLTDVVEYWAKAEDHLLREYGMTHRLTAPVSSIVHSLADVNTRLMAGLAFFADIVRDGIALYEAPGHPLEAPRPLAPAEALKEAQGYFDEWFPSAERRLDLAQNASAKGYTKEVAFDLHQTTKRLYHCILLVLTLYSPLCRAVDYA